MNSSNMHSSNLGSMTDTMTSGGDNVNSSENKNNHTGGLVVVVNNNGMGNSNGTSSVRASSVYDICHPLVM